MTKRIVFHEMQGPHRGLHHILGCTDEFGDANDPPDFTDCVEVRERISAASLVQVKPRYILYREICVPVGSETV